jgi:hypothetical protein
MRSRAVSTLSLHWEIPREIVYLETASVLRAWPLCVSRGKGETRLWIRPVQRPNAVFPIYCRGQLKCDGTRAEIRFRLSAKRTSPFKSAGALFSRRLAAAVMLDTPCSVVVRRVLATHSIRQFPLHFPARASPCAITFQLDFTPTILECVIWVCDLGVWVAYATHNTLKWVPTLPR